MHTPIQEFADRLFYIFVNGCIVLGVFVILLLNNKGVRKSRANTFLSILLAALTFSIFHLRYAGEIINHFSFKVFSFGDPTFLVIAPLLWFYITELTGGRVKWRINTLVHFTPFVLFVFGSLSFNSYLDHSWIITTLEHHPRLPFTIFWAVVVIQFTAYQFMIHRKWQEYQKVMKQEVSNTENVNISWVRFFMAVFLGVNASFLFSLFAVIHFDVMHFVWRSAGLILSLSIFALGYKGILQQEIFDARGESPVPLSKREELQAEKPDQTLIDKLLAFMQNQRPYLDPELSLSSLSKELGLNRNQLSHLINDGIGENFYDFVNKYRVEEVKRLMVDPKKRNYNLLGIALEAGFKSKSTFNLIFKRFTGLTPTEYKKNITTQDVQ
jgi:AraC-like DNA-binding protein